MKDLFPELETNTIPYKELQCIVGAYFEPAVINHQSWQTIAEEIHNYYSHRCIHRLLRQIETLLSNPSITDHRLVTWIHIAAPGWRCQQPSEARHSLRQLSVNLAALVEDTPKTYQLTTVHSC